jgi:lysozyme
MVNKATVDLIKSFEGLVLKAYVDPGTGGEPITIGYGTTIYKGIQKVKLGDSITPEQAEMFLTYDVNTFSEGVKKLITKNLTENQFGALVSFAYNVGLANLKNSTLLKKVNVNPNDPAIATEFGKWVRAGGKVMNGLVRRRNAESMLYFKK